MTRREQQSESRREGAAKPEFVAPEGLSSFRKMAAALWPRPNQSTIFGSMDLDATAALAFIEEQRRETHLKITITHLVARAVALTLTRHPDLNAKVRLWGKIERRTSVDLFLQVASDGGNDLSGAKISAADTKGLAEIAQELQKKAEKIRGGKDEAFSRSRSTIKALPWWLNRAALATSDLLANELYIHLPKLGMPADPFGSAMITSVGMFGIDTGFAPLFPLARCPMLILVPEIKIRPWVVEGAVLPRPVLRLCATFDHRIIDGHHAGILARDLSRLLDAPDTLR